MNEKELIELLKKPQVRAALKEITLQFQAVNIPTRKKRPSNSRNVCRYAMPR